MKKQYHKLKTKIKVIKIRFFEAFLTPELTKQFTKELQAPDVDPASKIAVLIVLADKNS